MPRKKKGPLRSVKEDDGTESPHAAFLLQSLITNAFDGNGFQKIKEYFEQKESHFPQKYGHLLLQKLDRSINKELDQHAFGHVSLLLTCVRQFFMDGPEEDEPLLIQQGLIPKMISWFERMTGFLTMEDLASDASLISATEDFLDTAVVISRCSRKGKLQMLDSFILSLGFLVTETRISHSLQQEAVRTLNFILQAVPREERKSLPLSESICHLMKDFARTIMTVGDYDQQVAASETLCRLTTRTTREELAKQWFEDNAIAEAFKDIKDREFETDIRCFLNLLNDRLGDQKRVYSFPCIAAFADGREMRKPADEKLEKFWIDFNLGSQSVTFYINNVESTLWDPVRLLKEAVVHFCLTETETMKILLIRLQQPIVISGKEAMKVEIHFDVQLAIAQAATRALGQDKQVLPDQMETSWELSTNFEKEDTMAMVPNGHDRETEQTEESTNLAQVMSPEDDHCPTVLPISEHAQLPQTETAEHLPEKLKPDALKKEVTSAHEYSSDLPESRVNAQSPELSVKARGDSAFNSDKRRARRRTLVNYRKHLFSDSNEDSSSSAGEHSWTGDQKKKLLIPYPNRRRKTKVRKRGSVLLPFSLSSASDNEKDQVNKPTLYCFCVLMDTSRQGKATRPEMAAPGLRGSPATVIPEDFSQTPEYASPRLLSGFSSRECSEAEENASKVGNRESLTDNPSVKHKLQNLEDRDVSPESSVKSKQSRLEGDAPGSPRVAANTPPPLAGSEGFSTPPSPEGAPEGAKGSAIITAFESFSRRLRRKYELGHRQSLLHSDKAKQAPECLKLLLNQIHLCRLNKLEQFHNFVVQELSSIEKDMQALSELEENVLEFWGKQSADLKSFCDRQVLRLNPMHPS
ncbi:synaptonemal complex protein 2-like [Ochotona curzoniae]|uniref:synaptonemal complex protein 2-like n=1 Tax=Ochotona curzoniae TaxID=130825 RepID=UPI001B34C6B3|nr:synaptonemal complex protein 2-like [Ochotona curzoniae]